MYSNETTRLLCASGLLSRQFRTKVLKHLEDKTRACSPEIGVDLPLVAQVCQFAAEREDRLIWYYFMIALGGTFAGLFLTPIGGLFLIVVASAAFHLKLTIDERRLVRRYFQRRTFDVSKVREAFPAHLKPEYTGSFPRQDQNLIVYHGFTPFIGAGINLGGWSFAVDVDKPCTDDFGNTRQNKTTRFTPDQFYASIDNKLYSSRLDRISIDDYCFISGDAIREDRSVLPDTFGRPVQKLDDSLLAMCKNTSDPRVRHYQWIRIHDGGNELVMSYFLRSALRGGSLFVEINRFLLTPLSTTYRKADRMAEFGFSEFIGAAGKSLVIGPAYAFFSGLLLLGRAQEGLAHLFDAEGRKTRKEIETDPLYNYGAQSSLRYTFSSDTFLHYFQKLDGEFYSKVLEHQILDGIIDFLDEHNVDTSEIRERRTTILNSGVIVQGGDLKAESLAVGAGATAVKTQNTTTQKKTAREGG